MNRRKGFRRLAVAVGGPWFSFWALVDWVGYYGYDKAQNAMSDDLRAQHYSMMTRWSEQSAPGLTWMKNAMLWGVDPITIRRTRLNKRVPAGAVAAHRRAGVVYASDSARR